MRRFPYTAHTWAWIFVFLCLGALLFLMTHPMGLNSAVDIQLHDTYFVIANAHIIFLCTLILSIIGFAYHWGKDFWKWNNLSLLHVWISGICVILIFLYAISVGAMGVPRRYYTFEGVDSFSGLEVIHKRIAVLITVFSLAQILFVVHFMVSLISHFFRKK